MPRQNWRDNSTSNQGDSVFMRETIKSPAPRNKSNVVKRKISFLSPQNTAPKNNSSCPTFHDSPILLISSRHNQQQERHATSPACLDVIPCDIFIGRLRSLIRRRALAIFDVGPGRCTRITHGENKVPTKWVVKDFCGTESPPVYNKTFILRTDVVYYCVIGFNTSFF